MRKRTDIRQKCRRKLRHTFCIPTVKRSGSWWLYNSPVQRPLGSLLCMIFLIPDRHFGGFLFNNKIKISGVFIGLTMITPYAHAIVRPPVQVLCYTVLQCSQNLTSGKCCCPNGRTGNTCPGYHMYSSDSGQCERAATQNQSDSTGYYQTEYGTCAPTTGQCFSVMNDTGNGACECML